MPKRRRQRNAAVATDGGGQYCPLCEQTVPVAADGRCGLGHRVTAPQPPPPAGAEPAGPAPASEAVGTEQAATTSVLPGAGSEAAPAPPGGQGPDPVPSPERPMPPPEPEPEPEPVPDPVAADGPTGAPESGPSPAQRSAVDELLHWDAPPAASEDARETRWFDLDETLAPPQPPDDETLAPAEPPDDEAAGDDDPDPQAP